MRNLLEATIADVREAAQYDSALLVSPTHVLAAAQAPHVATVAGYPTGRHHSLIKASEARLAVQSGAAEVWVAVDALLGDATAPPISSPCARPARSQSHWGSSSHLASMRPPRHARQPRRALTSSSMLRRNTSLKSKPR